MSLEDFINAVKIIEENKSKAFFAGNRSESLIKEAEKALGITFPETYRQFLLKYGAGNFGGSEIYGIIDENFINSSIPDGIWFTLIERKKICLPQNLVVIYSTGDGDLVCLDTGKNRESPVIIFQPGVPLELQRGEVISEDFGRFFLELVKREI